MANSRQIRKVPNPLRCAALALGILSVTSLAGAAQELPVFAPISFADEELDAAFVSAPHWLRGLQYVSNRSERVPRLVTFMPPGFGGGILCIEATTIDGRYGARAEYDVPAGMAGRAVELEYTTDFPDVWSQSSLADSGVVVSLGACENAPAEVEPVLLASILNGAGSLRRTAQDEVTLVFNIHARAAQEVLASLETSGGSVPVSCDKVASDAAIEFNFTCTATVSAGVSGMAELSHSKISRGREKPGPTARILLPRFE